jgi:hypothetical protein
MQQLLGSTSAIFTTEKRKYKVANQDYKVQSQELLEHKFLELLLCLYEHTSCHGQSTAFIYFT